MRYDDVTTFRNQIFVLLKDKKDAFKLFIKQEKSDLYFKIFVFAVKPYLKFSNGSHSCVALKLILVFSL